MNSEIMLDTANLEEIRKALDTFPVTGLTTNPSILVKDGAADDPWKRLDDIRKLLGDERSLHVQVTGKDAATIIREAHSIRGRYGANSYVKIPVSPEGLEAMQILRKDGIRVTATAIVSTFQAITATLSGASYLAIYYGRMMRNGIDGGGTVKAIRSFTDENPGTKILTASIKTPEEMVRVMELGSHSVTVPPSVLWKGLDIPLLLESMRKFEEDWAQTGGAPMLR